MHIQSTLYRIFFRISLPSYCLVFFFSFYFLVVSSVKCPLWWDTEFLSLVRLLSMSESFSLFFLCFSSVAEFYFCAVYCLSGPSDCCWFYFKCLNSVCCKPMCRAVCVCAGTDATAIVNCLHILARSLDARFCTYYILITWCVTLLSMLVCCLSLSFSGMFSFSYSGQSWSQGLRLLKQGCGHSSRALLMISKRWWKTSNWAKYPKATR